MTEFKLTEYPLRYLIGDTVIFEKKYILNCHFANPCILKVNDDRYINAPKYSEVKDGEGFYFSSIPVSSNQSKITSDNGHIRYLIKKHRQNYVDLSTSFDDYLAKFSSKSRSTIKRKIRKFEKLSGGEIEWRSYETREEVLEFYKLAREVSIHTYQENLLNMGLPVGQEFIDNMTREAEKGNVRGYLLFLEGKPISYLYCPIAKRTIDYAFLGYLPEAAKYSAGTVLFVLALEKIFVEQGVDYYDLKEGQSSHKTLFSTGAIDCANIMYLKDTLANHFWVRTHHYLYGFLQTIIDFLEKMGMKEKLKKLVRRNA